MTGRTETAAVGIERQLARYRDLTYRALLAQLPTREPRRYLYDLISGQLSHVGKGLRPALCIATCRAFGGSIEQALPSAVTHRTAAQRLPRPRRHRGWKLVPPQPRDALHASRASRSRSTSATR